MGTDIHMLVERRYKYQGHMESWERVLPTPAARDWPEWRKGSLTDADSWAAVRWATAWYDSRNYSLFAMLADVRNGYGFAGVPTGEGFKPIHEPKGWPTDPGEHVAAFIAAADGSGTYPIPEGDIYPGDHTPSWLSLRELNGYDWAGQVTRRCGIVPLEVYAERKAKGVTGPPEAWSGGISGPGITTMEEDEADAAIAGGGIATAIGARPHVRVWWSQTYADCAGTFYSKTLPALNSLLRLSGDFITTEDDVRIVFNFDS